MSDAKPKKKRRLSDEDPRWGLFHPANPLASRPLAERISAYAEAGRRLDPSDDRPPVGSLP